MRAVFSLISTTMFGKLSNHRYGITLCLGLIIMLSSCERNVEKPAEGQENSEIALYYNYGLKPEMLVVATDSFYINTEPQSRFSGKNEIITYKGIENFEMGVDDFRGARIHKGDTLEIVGGFARNVLKNGKNQDFIQVRQLKNGQVVANGWNCFGISNTAPVDNSWTAIFSSNAQERMVNMMTLIVCALAALAVYFLWLLIYWLIVAKIKDDECFWKYKRIVSRPLFYLASIFMGLLYFLIDFSKPLSYSLRFNPDIFATWSEQPLCVKLFPIVFAIWIVLAIIMLVEMIIKFRTIWLVIYYPGKIAIGLLIVAAVIMASWLIYIIFPTVIAFVWVSLFGKADDYTGGALSGRGKRQVIGYHNGAPVYEGSGMTVTSQSAGKYD